VTLSPFNRGDEFTVDEFDLDFFHVDETIDQPHISRSCLRHHHHQEQQQQQQEMDMFA